MVIRPATLQDIDSIHKIEQEVEKENAASKDTLIARLKMFAQGFCVAEEDNDIVGYIESCLWDKQDFQTFDQIRDFPKNHNPAGKTLYVIFLAVREGYKKRGIGSALVRSLQQYVLINKLDKLQLVAGKGSLEEFYKKLGFMAIKDLPGFIPASNEPYFAGSNGVLMEYKLFSKNSQTEGNVCKALNKVLDTLSNGNAPLVIPYANNSAILWDLDNLKKKMQIESPSAQNRIVLIWDESEKKSFYGIDTDRYLNPLTWGLCALKKYKELKLVIIDFNSHKHATERFYQVVQALDPAKLPFRLITDPSNCVEKYQEDFPVTDSGTVLELLTNEMCAIVTDHTKKDDHHAIANIVGPLILMDNNPLINNQTVRDKQTSLALLTLFRYLHLSKTPDEKEVQIPSSQVVPEEEIKKDTPPSLFEGLPVRLLLVDDQADRGWDNWVFSMVKKLEKDANFRVEKINSPNSFLSGVVEQNTIRSNLGNRFNLKLPKGNIVSGDKIKQEENLALENRETILLLDLRLFSHDNEKKFIEKLVPFCRFYEETTYRMGSFAWPGFSTEELEFAEKWCKIQNSDSGSNDEHFQVLSFLPRLLALMDFSLPIVLFSSTGQKKIIKLLEPYKNIITDFEKPRFTGMETEDIVKTTERSFYAVLKKAAEIARVVSKMREVRVLKLEQYNDARQLFEGKKHIEIFHDESSRVEWSDFRVAAFAVGFPSEPDANATNTAIINNGPTFFGDKALPKYSPWNAIATPLANALTIGNVAPLHRLLTFIIYSGKLQIDPLPVTDQFSLLDPTGLDNVNQEFLRLLLEVMIVDTIAWISDTNIQTCRIFGSTRMRYQIYQQNEPTNDEIERIKKKIVTGLKPWGIYISPGQVKQDLEKKNEFGWPSLRSDSLHVLLNDLLTARNKSKMGISFANRIDSAFCQKQLNEKDTPSEEEKGRYRRLKNIADQVARLAYVNHHDRSVTWGDELCLGNNQIPLRGVARYKHQIVQIIKCHRALDENDLIDGFSFGLKVNYTHDVAGNVVALRLQKAILQLSGEDFIRIVHNVTEAAEEQAAFEAILLRWRIREFNNDIEYFAANVLYHQKEEYQVRHFPGSERVVVFADRKIFGYGNIPDFIEPSDLKLFHNCMPAGVPFKG